MAGEKRILPLVLAGFIAVLLILQVVNDQFIGSAQLFEIINVLFIIMVVMIAGYAIYMLWSRFKG